MSGDPPAGPMAATKICRWKSGGESVPSWLGFRAMVRGSPLTMHRAGGRAAKEKGGCSAFPKARQGGLRPLPPSLPQAEAVTPAAQGERGVCVCVLHPTGRKVEQGSEGGSPWRPPPPLSSTNIGPFVFHLPDAFRCAGHPSQWLGMMGVAASGLGKGCFATPDGWEGNA